MNSITLPYHLLIPSVISLTILILLVSKRKYFDKKYKKSLWIYSLIFFVIYSFMVGKNTFDDIYYQWNLNQYDLNQDGFFTGDEVTEEFRIALKLLTQDTSRNFSFITGAIFSLLVSTPIYFMSLIIEKVKSSNYIHCNPKNFNI